jgi:RecA/RadA recombinase
MSSREERALARRELITQKTKKLEGLLFTEVPPNFVYSTGVYSLDRALRGGIPSGRFIGIYGQQSCGKSSTALRILGEVNKINWETGEYDPTYENPCGAAFIDLEDSFKADWAKAMGFDESLEENNVFKIVGGENVGDYVRDLIDSDSYSAIVVDSFESMMPLSIVEESMETNEQGRRAQLLAKCFRKWVPAMVRSSQRNKETPWKCPVIIYLNHAQIKPMITYHEWVIPGGGSQRYYASIEIIMSKLAQAKDDTKDFGKGKFKGTIEKNKFTGDKNRVFTYNMQMRDDEESGVSAGDVDNASEILSDLEIMGLCHKVKEGYEILGDIYRIKRDFSDKLRSEIDFERDIWKKLIERL